MTREAAWDAVHEALPARWEVGPVSYDCGPSRSHDRLRGVPKRNGTRQDELRRRLRFAYLEGADDWAERELGRKLTADELEGVTGHYKGR